MSGPIAGGLEPSQGSIHLEGVKVEEAPASIRDDLAHLHGTEEPEPRFEGVDNVSETVVFQAPPDLFGCTEIELRVQAAVFVDRSGGSEIVETMSRISHASHDIPSAHVGAFVYALSVASERAKVLENELREKHGLPRRP
jgi:hypothetical protein